MTEIDVFQTQLLYTMSKGNPGALSLLMRVLIEYRDIVFPCFCYDLENRKLLGGDIWYHFKDIHKENFDEFFNDVWTGAGNSNSLKKQDLNGVKKLD